MDIQQPQYESFLIPTVHILKAPKCLATKLLMDIQQPQYESFLIHTEHIYNTERSLLACIVISLIIKCIILDGKKINEWMW